MYHHFERFLAEVESRFERDDGDFRPVGKDIAERHMDCGNSFLIELFR